MNRTRPGPGWKHLGCAVYEHSSGMRIHTHGLCRFRGGPFIDGTMWPEWQKLNMAIRVNGGNRRRGVMVWALEYMRRSEGDR